MTTPTTSIAWRAPRLSGRIPELDGVRGLAILLVLIWHYLVLEWHPAMRSWPAYALVPLRLTWTGVDLFFVLSGFLIGGILFDARQANNYYRTFYQRRVYRIFPLYFLWMALFLVGRHFVGPDSPRPLTAVFNRDLPAWPYLLFLQNFVMSSHQTFGSDWLGITWSLAVEEQFYAVFPFVVRHLSRRALTGLAVAAVVCAPIFRFVLWRSGNLQFAAAVLLPSRADAFGFGVLVALACRHQAAWHWLASHRRHVQAAFLVFGCGVAFLTLHPSYLDVLGSTWMAGFYALLLVLAIVNPGRIERACFGNLPLMTLGTGAYAVYIFHQGTNALLHYTILGTSKTISDPASLGITLLSVVTVMALATLSWRVLERPLIHRAHSRYRYVTGASTGH